MVKMRLYITFLMGSLLVACVKKNPDFCNRNQDCIDGQRCNLDTNRCEALPEAGASCTSNNECSTNEPVCGSDGVCRRCELDDECASRVCQVLEGVCEPADRVLYVAPQGIAAGTCSEATPCDLQYARSLLTLERRAIRLADGTYNLASDFIIKTPATIVGGRSAIVERTTSGAALSVSDGGSLTLRGFTAHRGVACSDSSLEITSVAFDAPSEPRPWIDVGNCEVTIATSELSNASADAVVVVYGLKKALIVDTTIRNSAGNGIRVEAGRCVVTTSRVTGNAKIGMTFTTTDVVVSRSVIASNRLGGIRYLGGPHYDITNNFVYRNGTDSVSDFGGLHLVPDTTGNRVLHNTITFNDSDPSTPLAGGLYCKGGSAANNIIVNNFAGNATMPNSNFAGNCDTSGSLISGVGPDPQFVSAAIIPYDYHLANASSPAVGAAIATDVTIDFDGQPRPNGQPDIGADEFYP